MTLNQLISALWWLITAPVHIVATARTHLTQFHFDQDPIKDVHSLDEVETLQRHSRPMLSVLGVRLSAHYCPPVLWMVYFFADNLYTRRVVYADVRDQTELHTERITHRIFPQSFWAMSDVLMDIGTAEALMFFVYLSLRPQMDPGYFMFYLRDSFPPRDRIYYRGKFWSEPKAQQFLRYRHRMRAILTPVMFVIFLEAYGYYMFCHTMNGNIVTSVRNLALYVYMFFYAFYGVYSLLFIPLYFFMAARYVQMSVKRRLVKLRTLLCECTATPNQTSTSTSATQLWIRFVRINTGVLRQNRELAAYDHFWGWIVSLSIAGYGTIITFLAYIFLFGRSTTGGSNGTGIKSFYLVFAVQLLFLVLLITEECATVVRLNEHIYRCNVRFAFQFGAAFAPQPTQSLRMNKMVANFRGSRSGFRLVTGTIIDSKVFEMLVLSITVVFMKIFKQENFGNSFLLG